MARQPQIFADDAGDLFDWINRNQDRLAGDISGDDEIERAIEAEGIKSGQTIRDDVVGLRSKLRGLRGSTFNPVRR